MMQLMVSESNTKFNGKDLLGFSVKMHQVAVSDAGSSIHFKSNDGFTSVSDNNTVTGSSYTC